MSVHDVPSYEEYFGLIDNVLKDSEFDSNNKDEDIKKLVILSLSLFQEFYIEHMYSSEYEISSEEFKEKIDSFNSELKEFLIVLFTGYVDELNTQLAMKYDLPYSILDDGMLKLLQDIKDSISSSVDAVTNPLYYDLKDKADFYKDMAITTGVFSVHSNFRRALKKLNNVVDYKAQYARKRAERVYLEFVYGQEALFQWRVSGINTCPWCYEMEAKGAMPLSWFPVDHVNGGCWLEPVEPNEYSKEYEDLMGE